EAWLRGTYGGAVSAPITQKVVTRPTEVECFADIEAGRAVAAVTANFSYVEFGCPFSGCTNHTIPNGGQPDLQPYREAPVEPRAAVISRIPGDETLLVAV